MTIAEKIFLMPLQYIHIYYKRLDLYNLLGISLELFFYEDLIQYNGEIYCPHIEMDIYTSVAKNNYETKLYSELLKNRHDFNDYELPLFDFDYMFLDRTVLKSDNFLSLKKMHLYTIYSKAPFTDEQINKFNKIVLNETDKIYQDLYN